MLISASALRIDILGGYQGGTEPWERTASIKVDPQGFHETHLLGYSGERTPLSLSEVASSLITEFELSSLLQLLDHVVELRALLGEKNSKRA